MLRISKDAYERAHDKTRNSSIRELYGVLASSRIFMISELEEELRSIRSSEEFPSVQAQRRWRRVWKEIRNPSWLLGEGSALKAVHRSECRLLSVYDRNLLQEDLPQSLIDLLGQQRIQILNNVSNIVLFLRSDLVLAGQ